MSAVSAASDHRHPTDAPPRPRARRLAASAPGRGGAAGRRTSRAPSSCCWWPRWSPGSWWSGTRSRRPTGRSRCRGVDAGSRCCATARASRRCTPRPATTCSTPRASCRRRTGSSRWTSAGTPRPGGSRRCSASPTLAIDKTVRTMGWRRVAEQEVSRLAPATQGLPAGLQRRRERLPARPHALGDVAGVHAAGPHRPGLHGRGLDARGLGRLAEGDGVGPARQHGRRDPARPDVGDPHARRDRRPVPAVPVRPAPAHRRPGRGRGRGVRAGRDRGRHPQAVASAPGPGGRAGAGAGGPRTARDAADAGRGRRGGDGIGSNAWVVDGDALDDRRSRSWPTTRTWACPCPGIWYQMGLHCTTLGGTCPFDVTGFTFSGLPGVVIGHNRQIAWGFTNLGPDVIDLYLEKVTGQHLPVRRAGSGRCGCATRRSRCSAATTPFRFTVRSTRHGPLLSDVDTQLSTVGANAPAGRRPPERGQRVRRGAVVDGADAHATPPTRSSRFDRADGLDAVPGGRPRLRGAVAEHASTPTGPATSATRRPGRIPIRKSGRHRRLPGPRLAARRRLDRQLRAVRRAAQRAQPRRRLRGHRQPGRDRRRLPLLPRRLLGLRLPQPADRRPAASAGAKLGVEDMSRAPARHPQRLRAHARAVPAQDLPALAVPLRRPAAAAGLELHRRARGSPAAAYYNAVWRNLLALTFHDELKESVWPDGGGRWFEVVRRLLTEPDSPWWDDVTTDGVIENRDDILAEAMVGGPRRAGAAPGPPGRGLDLGAPAPARPGEPDPGPVRLRPGARAVQPGRLRGRRRQRDRGRDQLGRGRPTTTTSPRRPRCGWWSRWPTWTRPAGSTSPGPPGTPSTALRRPDRPVGRGPHAGLAVQPPARSRPPPRTRLTLVPGTGG